MIIVLLDSFIFSKTDIISSVVLLSSAPVGSSASITDGSLTIARAIAARCFCPPDSLLQCLSACSFIPTSSSALCAVFLLSLGLFLQNQEGAIPSCIRVKFFLPLSLLSKAKSFSTRTVLPSKKKKASLSSSSRTCTPSSVKEVIPRILPS